MKNGFTLIELFIIMALVAIVAAVTLPIVTGALPEASSGTPSGVSYGVTGATEVRCIDGFKFVTVWRGGATQMLDTQGHGIACK